MNDSVGRLAELLAVVNERFLRGEVAEERYLEFLYRQERLLGQLLYGFQTR
ncbi:MAG: hypothetical protein HY558_03870 [Euryarchaeota archaeon]|nr:hypothetical protein [Euryarchaeota archaeon]